MTYQPVPMLIVASIWYLAVTSILMVGQYYLERHFAKGVGARPDVQTPSVDTSSIGVPGEIAGHPTYRSEVGAETIVPPHSRPGGGGA